jgi:hypothetical protein
MSVIVLILLPFCFSVKIGKAAASSVVYINMFNVLFQPAKKPDHTPKEKGTKSGENQVQFKNVL